MCIRHGAVLVSLVALVWIAGAASPAAQDARPAGLRDIGLDQRLNERVPLELRFRDERGRAVRLGDYFGAAPVLLTFNYFECPMLCPLMLNDVLRLVRAMPLTLGTEFRVITVSIDPHDTPAAAAAKARWYGERTGSPATADGWHFLTADDTTIAALAQAVGFRYAPDPATGQFAHVAGVMILTPDGRLAQYFYGLEYSPRDVRLALVEASRGTIGSLVDQVLLFCFHYDPASGRYGFAVLNAIRVAGGATVLGLVAFIVALIRRERSGATDAR